MLKEISKVCVTDNYGMFKRLEGNRDIADNRCKKIIKSIQTNGYIHSPIIVNENMEVIDGQGRLKALETLGFPVEYIVFQGMSIKECIALNVYQTGWGITDYIESYADRGNRSYGFLLHLLTKYSTLNVQIVFAACTGTVANGATGEIKTGDFQCTGEQYERAEELLDYVMKFAKTFEAFKKGPKPYICLALMFAYDVEGIDREKLVDKFERYYGMDDIMPFNDIQGALKALTQVYNRRNTKDKIYFEVEYDKHMTRKYTWYAKRYGMKLNG